MPPPVTPQALLLTRQRLRVGAALLLPFLAVEALLMDRLMVVAFVSRLVAVGVLWYCGERVVRRDAFQPWVGTVAGTFITGWIVAQTALQGGPPISLAFLPTMGLAVAMVLQEDLRAVVSANAMLLATSCAMFMLQGVAFSEALPWVLPMLPMGILSVWASAHFRTLQRTVEAKATDLEKALAEERHLRAELEAQRALSLNTERLALIGQLAAGVAHEVNNPLAVVKANVEYAAAELGDARLPPDRARELADAFAETSTAVERIRQVVVQLKAFARAPDGAARPVSVGEIIHRALEMAQLRIKPPLVLMREVPADLPAVTVDGERLSQIILGVLLNAMQALEELRRLPPSPSVHLAVRRGKTSVFIDVTDNGPGFPEAVLALLFTPFLTTKGEGAGMGLTLTLARDYLRSLGGNVTAENRPAGGAKVTLELPLGRPT